MAKLTYAQAYYLKTREKQITAAKKWYKENYRSIKAARAAYHKKWRQKNRLKLRAASSLWKKENWALNNADAARQRTSRLQRMPKWLTSAQRQEIKEWYLLCKELQWLSDPTDILTVDHIIPLQGKLVSGLHVPWNLQILPRSLNSSKNNKEQM